VTDHADHEYLLLTLQFVEEKLKQYPNHPTLAGQRSALIHAIARSKAPALPVVGTAIQAAGPEAVALRLLWSNVDRAADALGPELIDRPEVANDPQLEQLAAEAANAVANLRVAIQAKLRKLCGVEP